ncbi:MAG: hypothetical protein AAB413_01195 [Patescibacteria group bacterium]
MQKQTPLMANCSQCSRSFPIRAQMQVSGVSLPMLVVLPQVDSVEAALEQATCQVCLNKTGPADRGLHQVLKNLGLKDEDEAPALREAAVTVRPALEVPARTGSAVVISTRPREVTVVDPLMGTSIERPRLALPARDRGPRRDDRRSPPSESRLPRSLHQPDRHKPLPKVEHLTGAIGQTAANAAVLEVAMKAAKVRDEAKRLEREEKFNKLLFWLKLSLARIRKNAATTEVWNFVETFKRKLSEAASLDSNQRGKKGLLAELGTSVEGLEALCHEFYSGKEPLQPRRPIEVVTLDAFEGGRRPETWDKKGGRKPAFYQLKVVRTKNSLPVPNPPLPNGDEDQRPRIVYPEGQEFGSDYTVEHSQCLAGVEGQIDQIFDEVAGLYMRWLAIVHDRIGIGVELAKFDLSARLPAFFHDLKQVLAEEAAELAAEEAAAPTTEPTTITTSPELPATT